eukprot:scaffold3259_cov373-Prasinococcus_capsulatus_cf.AAC.6
MSFSVVASSSRQGALLVCLMSIMKHEVCPLAQVYYAKRDVWTRAEITQIQGAAAWRLDLNTPRHAFPETLSCRRRKGGGSGTGCRRSKAGSSVVYGRKSDS